MLHIQFLILKASSHGTSASPCTVLTSGVFCLLFSQNTSLQHRTSWQSSPLLQTAASSSLCSLTLFSVPSGLSSDSWITWAPPAALKALCLHSLCQESRLMDMAVYKHWNNTQTLNSQSTAELSGSWGAKALQEEQCDTHVTADYCSITNKR